MGKTADRLRERHPSRYNKQEVRLAKVGDLLRQHLGVLHPRLGSRDRPQDDVAGLITDISIAASEEARRRAGNESRKKCLAALRAMLRMPDDELIAVLPTCDMATFGRIQTAHAELDYCRNGIPAVEIPEADVSNDDWIAACNGDDATYVRIVDALSAATADTGKAASQTMFRRAIELPRPGQPLHFPMGIDGLKSAIANAVKVAEQEAGSAGNKPKPYMDDLARACWNFWKKYGPTEKRDWSISDDESYVSPRVAFTKDVFELAGIAKGAAWIAELLGRVKISN